jgi:hypothetical protein
VQYAVITIYLNSDLNFTADWYMMLKLPCILPLPTVGIRDGHAREKEEKNENVLSEFWPLFIDTSFS